MEVNQLKRQLKDLGETYYLVTGVSLSTTASASGSRKLRASWRDAAVWSNPARAQELGREARPRLTSDLGEIDRATKGIGEATELRNWPRPRAMSAPRATIERDGQRLEADRAATWS